MCMALVYLVPESKQKKKYNNIVQWVVFLRLLLVVTVTQVAITIQPKSIQVELSIPSTN